STVVWSLLILITQLLLLLFEIIIGYHIRPAHDAAIIPGYLPRPGPQSLLHVQCNRAAPALALCRSRSALPTHRHPAATHPSMIRPFRRRPCKYGTQYRAPAADQAYRSIPSSLPPTLITRSGQRDSFPYSLCAHL